MQLNNKISIYEAGKNNYQHAVFFSVKTQKILNKFSD